MPNVEHRSHKGLNDHDKNSDLPLRRRETRMIRFKSPQCKPIIEPP